MIRSHVTEALEAELADPRRPDTRAADMAFAAASALAFVTAANIVPVVGGVVAAVGIVEAQHRRAAMPPMDCRSHVDEAVNQELACRTLPRATEAWRNWCPWAELHDGEEVHVPPELEHPSEVGFEPTRLASYKGQAEDWAHPLPDGSRLHAHEFADGSVTLHRDKVDPARGPATASLHWLSETPEGNVVGTLLVSTGLAVLVALVRS